MQKEMLSQCDNSCSFIKMFTREQIQVWLEKEKWSQNKYHLST